MKLIKNTKDIEKCINEIIELNEGLIIGYSPSYSGGIVIPKNTSQYDKFTFLNEALCILDNARSEIKKNIVELLEAECDTKKMVYADMLRNRELGINIIAPLNMN